MAWKFGSSRKDGGPKFKPGENVRSREEYSAYHGGRHRVHGSVTEGPFSHKGEPHYAVKVNRESVNGKSQSASGHEHFHERDLERE